MIKKLLKSQIAIALLVAGMAGGVFSSTAQAALIDTSQDSFIDTNSRLEWMDFGINNIYTAQYVIDNLSTLYPSWRLPIFDEVIDLFVGNFESVADDTAFNTYYDGLTTGSLFYYLSTDTVGESSTFNPLFEVMGFDSTSGDGFTRQAGGLFLTDNGIGAVSIANRLADLIQVTSFDEVTAFVGQPSHRLTDNRSMNTLLLVRQANVSTPATLILFAFGLACLGFIRRRDNQR